MQEDSLLTESELRLLFVEVLEERAHAIASVPLRKRAADVLYMRVVRGLSYQDIAGELVLSVRTVQSHLEHAALRLGYNNSWAAMHRDLFRAFARAEARVENERG